MKARTDSDSAVIDLSHEDEVSLLKGTERQSGSINIRVDRNEGHGSRNSKRQRSEQSACVLERAACPLRLLRTKGIASSYNEGTVSLDDIFQVSLYVIFMHKCSACHTAVPTQKLFLK